MSWTIFEFTLCQIENIPEDLRVGSAIADGPPPVVLFQGDVVFPEPPEAPAVAADLAIGMDANGFGFFNVENVVLGTLLVDIEAMDDLAVERALAEARQA